MKYISSLFIVILMISCGSPQKSAVAEADLTTTVISTPSTQCNMCAMTIRKALKPIDGVDKVDVNIEQHTVSVKHVKTIDPSIFRQAISNAGYHADEIIRNPEAYEKLDECCKEGGME